MNNKRIFSKYRRKFNKNNENKSNKLIYFKYGIQATESGYIYPKQIESLRRSIIKKINKTTIICRLNPNINITKKPIEVRMGNGKGDIIDKIFRVKPGNIIYEINVLKLTKLTKIILVNIKKLPFKTKIAFKYEHEYIKYYIK